MLPNVVTDLLAKLECVNSLVESCLYFSQGHMFC